MQAYWTSVDGEYEDYEADVINCVLSNKTINILFVTKEDGELVQGRLSLKPTNEKQSTTAFWIYPDTKKEKSKFCDNQQESEETIIKADVSGKLHNFRGGQVQFSGQWTDEGGAKYEFEIDAKIA